MSGTVTASGRVSRNDLHLLSLLIKSHRLKFVDFYPVEMQIISVPWKQMTSKVIIYCSVGQ